MKQHINIILKIIFLNWAHLRLRLIKMYYLYLLYISTILKQMVLRLKLDLLIIIYKIKGFYIIEFIKNYDLTSKLLPISVLPIEEML